MARFTLPWQRTPAYEEFTQGQAAWRVGLLGFLIARRGNLVVAIGSALLTGSAWRLGQKLFGSATISLTFLFVLLVAATGITAVASLWYLRERSIRSLDMKLALHRLAAFIRDHHVSQVAEAQVTNLTPEQRNLKFREYLDRLCERLREYFLLQMDLKALGVAIRLAIPKNGGVAFKTFGRAGLSPGRALSSQDIPAERGIPAHFLKPENRHKVLVIHNLAQAAMEQVYEPTANDKRFKDDQQSVAVAALNGFNAAGAEDMIGLLCISSPKGAAFDVRYFDSCRFAADLAASSIALAVVLQLNPPRPV